MLSSLQLPAAPCPCRRPTSRARCVRVAAKKVSKATPVVAAPAVLPPVPPPPRSPPPPWAAPVAGALAAAALVYALSRSAAPKLSSAAAAPAPSSSPPPAPGPGPVLVTGAAGRTGRLVVEKLLAAGTPVRALVRTSESASLLPPDLPRGAVYVADCARDTHTLRTALHGCSALVVCTSATPKLKLSGGPPPPGAPPSFVYPEGGLPERVDWVGQRMQYAAARAEGVRRVVVVGSRGGTQPESALNSIGGSKTNILLAR